MRGHLPAPIAFENGRIFDFQGLMTLTLDRSYCTQSCITHRPLPTLKSKKLCCGRTDGRTDIWDPLY